MTLAYPAGWRRVLFRAPLWLWRLGFGPLLRNKVLLLTTIGRRSGKPRYTALEYSVLDGVVYVGSGWGMRTDWCQNLAANPHAFAETGLGKQAVVAVRATSEEEHRRLYHSIRGASPAWKDYIASHGIEDREDDFVAKRDRLVTWRLEPEASREAKVGPLRADLVWVPAVLVVLVIALIVVAS